MIKCIEIVSLSRGILGEDVLAHEREIGEKRLKEFGVKFRYSKNALKGIEYLQNHPEKRAEDLLEAFKDREVDMILCAIGGEDTYRLLPYLFENNELKKVINNKVFLGFSDSTFNHFMLHKLGLNTFYGQAFIPDVCEIGRDMLPYTKKYFLELLEKGTITKIEPSDTWYKNRQDYSIDAIGTDLKGYINNGFKLLQGDSRFEGKILGGCIDSIYDFFSNMRFIDQPELCKKYDLFPRLDDWKGKILLLETSEERPTPNHYREQLMNLRNYGVFDVVNGVLLGKPYDEEYQSEYEKIIVEVVDNKKLPIVSNINVGHSLPRCIIPFGINAIVDTNLQEITFKNNEK